MKDSATHRTVWTIEKRRVTEPTPYAIETFEGNLLLNEGITNLLTLGMGGAGTDYGNTNAYIVVGDSSTAAAATQTGLQAASNKAWAAMEATYPQVSNQSIIFRSVFDDGEAEFAWNEFSVGNSNDDSGQNLNRKVEAKGTKTAGESWTITCTITLS